MQMMLRGMGVRYSCKLLLTTKRSAFLKQENSGSQLLWSYEFLFLGEQESFAIGRERVLHGDRQEGAD